MSVGHGHKHDPNEDHLPELNRLRKLAWFKKGLAIKYKIDYQHDIPYLGGSSIDGKTIYIDRSVYATIVKLKLLEGLIAHEQIEGILLRHGYKYPGAHELASAGEDEVYKSEGQDPAKMQAKYPKMIKETETEKIKKVPKDLRLDPYSGKLLAAIKKAQKGIAPHVIASMKQSLSPKESLPN